MRGKNYINLSPYEFKLQKW